MNAIYIVTEQRISGDSKLAYPSWEKVCEYHREAKSLSPASLDVAKNKGLFKFWRNQPKALGNHKPYLVTIEKIDILSV